MKPVLTKPLVNVMLPSWYWAHSSNGKNKRNAKSKIGFTKGGFIGGIWCGECTTLTNTLISACVFFTSNIFAIKRKNQDTAIATSSPYLFKRNKKAARVGAALALLSLKVFCLDAHCSMRNQF